MQGSVPDGGGFSPGYRVAKDPSYPGLIYYIIDIDAAAKDVDDMIGARNDFNSR
jgi:hypothetical protein